MDGVAEALPGAPGLPVVFLHGQPGSGSDWDAVRALLPEQLPSIALDRPGYRSNTRPPGTMAQNAQWLLDELDAAGVADVVLVGHSYGGGVALAVADLAPDRIRGLVLVASVGPGCLDPVDAMLAAPVLGPTLALLAWSLAPRLARARLSRIERGGQRRLGPDEHLNLQVWADARHDHGALWRTFLFEQRELGREMAALDSRLPHITAPSIVLSDPTDKIVPITTARILSRQLPRARLDLVEHTGHHIPRRDPGAIAAAVTELVTGLIDGTWTPEVPASTG
jgi:pimeloyl-ACP methyl ester carboxylesterase